MATGKAQVTVTVKAVNIEEDEALETKARQFIKTKMTEKDMDKLFDSICSDLEGHKMKEQQATIGAPSVGAKKKSN